MTRCVRGFQATAVSARTRFVVRAQVINPSIEKDNAKVVTNVKVSEIPKKGVYCRCWRSGKFPTCDGTHVKHNKEAGDNVGPLIVSKDD